MDSKEETFLGFYFPYLYIVQGDRFALTLECIKKFFILKFARQVADKDERTWVLKGGNC